MTYEQTTLLAMELDGSHVGALVQIITETWSMTGTLTRVDQHDNREWEIIYPERRLVPSGGEIYAELWIGPWRGQVIGNQPVTVERVKGTLEAPERAAIREGNLKAIQWEIDHPLLTDRPGYYPDGMGEDPPEDVLEGTVVDAEAVDVAQLEDEVRRGERTINSARAAMGFPKLPPAPVAWPDLPGQG